MAIANAIALPLFFKARPAVLEFATITLSMVTFPMAFTMKKASSTDPSSVTPRMEIFMQLKKVKMLIRLRLLNCASLHVFECKK